MPGGKVNITIDQGSTFVLPFQLFDEDNEPVSLSGATIAGKIRHAPEDAAAIVSFTGTVVDGDEGEGQVSLTAAQTAALAVDDSGDCERDLTCRIYDVEVTYADGTVERVLEGFAYINPEVTK